MIFITKAILVFIVCSLLLSCSYLMTSDEYIIQGVESYQKGDYKEAVESFKHVLQRDGTNVIARNNLASIYLINDNISDAFFELERVIKIEPDYPDAYYNIGIIYTKIKMWKEGFGAFDKALSLGSKQGMPSGFKGELYYYMGVCSEQLGELENAVQYFEKALIFKPRDAASMSHLLYVYYYLGKYNLAENLVMKLEAGGGAVDPTLKKKLMYYSGDGDGDFDEGRGRRKRALGKNTQGIRVE